MSKSVNKVTILGNVGKDPDVRSTPSGTTVANISVATSERSKDKQGNWTDKTEWHNLVAFGKTADIVQQYVSKGSKIYVEGALQTQSWDDKQTGEKRYKTVIVIRELVLLSGSEQRNDGYSGGQKSSYQSRAQEQSYEDSEDQIPF